jgi:glucose-1-phosphate cytidylyltransferase
VLDYLSGGDDEPLEQAPLARLAEDGELFAFKHGDFWHPMDTVRDRDHLERLACEPTPPWLRFAGEPNARRPASQPALAHA